MKRSGKAIGRSEVTERLDKHQEDAKEKADQIEETVFDSETERDVLESMELGGTEEGSEQVEQNIEQAQDASRSEFDEGSQELEEVHEQTQEYEGEMHERSDSAGEDAERVEDGLGKLNSDAAKGQLKGARDALQSDIKFLNDYEQRAQEARQESQQLHEEQQRRIDAAGGK
jgi:uncharacterized phage infection (PIP) family protein YhgE